MRQKLNESVHILDLIKKNPLIFLPQDKDFAQVKTWYISSIDSLSNQADSNFLARQVNSWILFQKAEEDKLTLLFRRLIASILLQLNDFSSIILNKCTTFSTTYEIKEAIKIIIQHATTLESDRVKHKKLLDNQLTLLSKNNTQSVSTSSQSTSTSSQNASTQATPKYWIWSRSHENWRRTIYLDKKTKNNVYSVKMGGVEFQGYRACPLFDSVQQAEAFLDNFKQGKSASRREPDYLQMFTYKVVEINDKKYKTLNFITSKDLQNYILVDTMCGKAYLDSRITF